MLIDINVLKLGKRKIFSLICESPKVTILNFDVEFSIQIWVKHFNLCMCYLGWIIFSSVIPLK